MHPWQSLRQELGQKAHHNFHTIRAAQESLDRFSCADELLEFLHDRTAGDAEQKNRILAALIQCTHDFPDLFASVRAVLFVALFPALDRVFHALLPHVRNTRNPAARLTNDIFWAFHLEIETWDFEARSRVAATLQLNVRRKIKHMYLAETAPTASPAISRDSAAGEQDLTDSDIPKLYEILRSVPKLRITDIELVIGRLVQGRSFVALSQHLGIKEVTARQRFHRAIKRLRYKKNFQLFMSRRRG
ncbi:MAG: hypothetical protein P9M14_12825 [Candidatus Alcyoniella australis]|nr:hypothetical protein [Candidatus Alcyoniella australis]